MVNDLYFIAPAIPGSSNKIKIEMGQRLNAAIKIVEQAEKTRELQKKYFKSRSKSVLYDAKDAEQALDQMIKEFKQGPKPQTLFDD